MHVGGVDVYSLDVTVNVNRIHFNRLYLFFKVNKSMVFGAAQSFSVYTMYFYCFTE